MSNVLKNLKANLEGDPVAIMSKARVIETIAEIESLTNQLYACIREVAEAGKRQGQAEAERDALRALLREARSYVDDDAHPLSIAAELLARIDAALKGGGDE